MTRSGEKTLISLGSNSPNGGDSAASSVQKARDALLEIYGSEVARVSRTYLTPAFPAGIGPDFVNLAMIVITHDSPETVLAVLHDIEAAAGRTRTRRWGDRTLDLDLIAVGQAVLPDVATQTRWRDLPLHAQRTLWPDRLILPHPRMQDRAFVLVPLAEVAPDWVHPVTGRSVTQMRDALPAADLAGLRVLET